MAFKRDIRILITYFLVQIGEEKRQTKSLKDGGKYILILHSNDF